MSDVQTLLIRAINGEIARRDLIKRATFLGVDAPTMRLLLAAHERARADGERRSNEMMAEHNARVLARLDSER